MFPRPHGEKLIFFRVFGIRHANRGQTKYGIYNGYFLFLFLKKKHFIPHIYTYIRHKLIHNRFKDYHIQVVYSFYTSKLEPKIYNVNAITSY